MAVDAGTVVLRCCLATAMLDCNPGYFLSAGGGPKGPSTPMPLVEMQASLRERARDLEAEFQRSCGCAVAVRFDDIVLQSRDMTGDMESVLADIGIDVGLGCNNAPSKNTIYCKMTTLEVVLVNQPGLATASFKDGVATAMVYPHDPFHFETVERAIGPY